MKTILKWLIKKFATPAKIKTALHNGNARLAAKEASDRTKTIMGYGEDASATVAVYMNAYANDGKMDTAEQAACDAKCDEMVDKYLSEEQIDAFVDSLFD